MKNRAKKEIVVLRLSHRKERDKRITTHAILVARAFFATKCLYTGDRDIDLENRIRKIVEKWGGNFEIEYLKDWRTFLKDIRKENKYSIVHLTMYGIPIQNLIDKLKEKEKILVIIGSEKVPREIYSLSDYNVAITNQPHSEIAALAIFLDKILEGEELFNEFNNAKIRIVPSECAKKVIRNDIKEDKKN